MRNKIITNKKVIFSRAIAKDSANELENFLSTRFYSVNQSHNCAIVIGSSLAHQDQDMEQDMILDSSGALATTDKVGTINGARVAVTDGLGGGAGDQQEDEMIHEISQASCEAFLDCDENIDATLDLISQATASRKNSDGKGTYDAHASIAAFIYKYQQGERYSGEFANIGDGLIIVLDKHYKIKNTLCARHIYRGFGTWTPSSLQTLTSTSNRDNVLVRQTLELAEGDIIVSMTDGIWGELASDLISQTKDHRDIDIDRKSFETLLEGFNGVPYPSSFDIARRITNQAISQSLKRRKTLVTLIQEIEEQDFQEKAIKTVNDALAYLVKIGHHKTAKTLKAVLFEQAMNDGITYFENMEIPLDVVMHDLKSRTVGDCSTINVTRIPYHLDELIRCFIRYPEKCRVLSPQFEVTIKSEADLEQAFKRLSLEVIQSEVESGLSKVHFAPAFKKETLNKTQTVLTHFFRITTHLDSKKSYQKWLSNLSAYITQESSLEKEDIKLLLSMLEDKIKPKKGFFQTFLGENQSKLYKAFQKQIELQFLDSERTSDFTLH
ncbi:phosphocholine hydrolase Lem3 [Legionella resiliens]|uniref:Phosphocholine hydrolase Lem3 n=1 Tax=Legionella resiliens TaxID=2905958 RepID=A0ABS8X8Z7_9GAMM|nr:MULTISPECIES: phosphocholine hydrolase Lem3 [unclassified Legionella]MCE0724403.1 phosphocholine hydrolase Lem3 [Legionella sp. 9fVS26]MCE3533555.1 phosphocholine hydrolase Lem3 [Legionella sp. 8cVS16]